LCSRRNTLWRGETRGGKTLWLKQVLQRLLEGFLVGFDRHEVIASLCKEDLLTGLDLRVRRVA
jgi:hypothetical protein